MMKVAHLRNPEHLNESLLRELNRLEYYQSPISQINLANEFGTDVVLSHYKRSGRNSSSTVWRTMTEHVVIIKSSLLSKKLIGGVSNPSTIACHWRRRIQYISY
jgi:hypothetical protein